MNTLLNLHDFWFGRIELTEEYYRNRIPYWFFRNNSELDQWSQEFFKKKVSTPATPKERLSWIIFYDQLPRNAFREDHRAFAFDSLALDMTIRCLEIGDEKHLSLPERIFLYMPLEHSECNEHQDLAVEKFYELHREASKDIKHWTRLGLDKALEHQEVIRKFQRFPARNKKMGRISSPYEKIFLNNLALY